jgi:carboxylesterase type B
MSLFAVLLAGLLLFTHALDTAEVTTTEGRVIGLAFATHEIFLGLPFASPPLGALRLKLPQPPAAASEIKYAQTFGDGCSQAAVAMYTLYSNISEDCLTLNVYRPHGLTPTSTVPVRCKSETNHARLITYEFVCNR